MAQEGMQIFSDYILVNDEVVDQVQALSLEQTSDMSGNMQLTCTKTKKQVPLSTHFNSI